MPPMMRWFLYQRWAWEVRSDALAQADFTLAVVSIALAVLTL